MSGPATRMHIRSLNVHSCVLLFQQQQSHGMSGPATRMHIRSFNVHSCVLLFQRVVDCTRTVPCAEVQKIPPRIATRGMNGGLVIENPRMGCTALRAESGTSNPQRGEPLLTIEGGTTLSSSWEERLLLKISICQPTPRKRGACLTNEVVIPNNNQASSEAALRSSHPIGDWGE